MNLERSWTETKKKSYIVRLAENESAAAKAYYKLTTVSETYCWTNKMTI
jgi:hypothetical protein